MADLLLAAAAGLGPATLFGFAILLVPSPRIDFETLLFAPSVGLGIVAYLLFLQNGAFNIGYTTTTSLWIVVLILAVSGAVIAAFRRRFERENPTAVMMPSPGSSRAFDRKLLPSFLVIMAPMVVTTAFLVYFARHPIVIFYDNIAYVAKRTFFDGTLPHYVSLSSAEYANAYPPLLPLQGAWLYNLAGSFSDGLLRVYPVLYFLTFVGVSVLLIRKSAPSIGLAVLALVFVFANQETVFISEDINASAPLSVFSAIALYFAASHLQSGRRRDLVLSGLTAGLAAFSNYYGGLFALALFGGLCFSLKKESIKESFAYIAPLLVIALPFYVRNRLLFGNPVYPYFGTLFAGNGFPYFPSFLNNLLSLGSEMWILWSVPAVVFFLLGFRHFRKGGGRAWLFCVTTVTYAFLTITLTSPDWGAFVPVIIPMSILAAKSFEYPIPIRKGLALVAALLLFAAASQYMVVPVGGHGFFSLTSIWAYLAVTSSVVYLIAKGGKLRDDWYKPASVIFLLVLLVLPTYAAMNLKFVTVSVNEKPYPFVPQLYMNFTSPGPNEVILNGIGPEYRNLTRVYFWANSNLPADARVLSPFANPYYIDREVVPIDGYEMTHLIAYKTTCGLLTQLSARSISYLIADSNQSYPNGSVLGALLQHATVLYRYGNVELAEIYQSCS